MFCGDALVMTIDGSLWSIDDKEEPASETCTRRVPYISSLTSEKFLALLGAFREVLCSVFFLPSCMALRSLNTEEMSQSLLPIP